VQPGSGSGKWNKSDVVKPGKFRVEAKLTKANSFSIKKEVLDKITNECAYNETPFLAIDFVDRDMHVADSWVVVPYEWWVEHVRKE